jgi:membrane-associated phospholipid phosphatase
MLLDSKHFNITTIADLISAIPLTFYFIPIYEYVRTRAIDQLLFFLGILFITVSTDLIKRIPYSKSSAFYHITRRPEGAENCDYLSKMGPARPDAPGFPSGHMATTAFFGTYMYLLYPDNHPFTLFNILLVLGMGWARYFKKCHNMAQIVAGTIYGGLGAVVWKWIF